MAKMSEKDRMKQIGRDLTDKVGDDPTGVEMVRELLQYHSSLRQKNQQLTEQVQALEQSLRTTKEDLAKAMKGLDQANKEIEGFAEQARSLNEQLENLSDRYKKHKKRYDRSIRMHRKVMSERGYTAESLMSSLEDLRGSIPFDSLEACQQRKETLVRIAEAKHASLVNITGHGEYFLHQDAYAPFYHIEEMLLLGIFIKWAGLRGEHVIIMGKAGEVCGPEDPGEMTAEKVIAANEIHIQVIAERFVEQMIGVRKGGVI